MKKLLACGLILTMLSSTGAMCFANEGVEIVDTVQVVSTEVTSGTQDEKVAEKEELLKGVKEIKEDKSLTWKEKASRAWEYVKDFVKRHYVAIGVVTVSTAILVLACVFGPRFVKSIVTLFKSDKEETNQAEKEEAERIAREQAEKEEAERLAREQAEKEEAERLAREQAEKEEAERLAREQAEKEEAERLAREQAEKEEAERLAREQVEKEEQEESDDEIHLSDIVCPDDEFDLYNVIFSDDESDLSDDELAASTEEYYNEKIGEYISCLEEFVKNITNCVECLEKDGIDYDREVFEQYASAAKTAVDEAKLASEGALDNLAIAGESYDFDFETAVMEKAKSVAENCADCVITTVRGDDIQTTIDQFKEIIEWANYEIAALSNEIDN